MTFIECFSKIKDPRRSQGMRTSLEQLLTMTVLSYLCGHFGYRGVHRFCVENVDFFVNHLSLRHGVPSHVSFRSVLSQLNEKELMKAFKRWSDSYVPLSEKEWLSVDGKALGSTVKDSQGSKQDFEGVVSIFAHKSGLVKSIAHYKKKSKEEGEAPLARQIMGELKNMGLIFTMDAGNTQKKQ